MNTQPIKRDKNLQSLSREHHAGLLACWKIRQGLKNNIDPERIKKYFLFFWENHLKSHFEEEETLLFIDSSSETSVALKQHSQIRELVNGLSHGVGDLSTTLTRLQSEIENHIRYEERVAFPLLEKSLSESQLRLIGDALSKSQTLDFCDNYSDEFWKY